MNSHFDTPTFYLEIENRTKNWPWFGIKWSRDTIKSVEILPVGHFDDDYNIQGSSK